MEFAVGLLAASAAFVLSATFGLGGSLILVPALVLMIGVKQGVALAALLLALNNVPKFAVYRRDVPWRACRWIVAVTVLCAAIGAVWLTVLPERTVQWVVATTLLTGGIWEFCRLPLRSSLPPATLAAASGLTSGVSGTSGPLKGLALRTLGLPKGQLVAAASVVSLAGDLTKTVVFTEAGLLTPRSWMIGVALAPLMIGGTLLGRRINQGLREKVFALGFWAVMGGYGSRLLLQW